MNSLTVQTSILIGAVLISLSILVHGGIIKVGKTDTVAAPVAQAPVAAQVKTEAQIVEGLKKLAGKLSLKQNDFNQCLDSGAKTTLVDADLAEGSTLGVGGTPSFFVNGRELFIGAAPFADFKKIIDEELNSTAPANTVRKTVAVGNLPIKGNLNAPVTLVEYSDYQCPFCSRFYTDAEKSIIKEYVDTGKVKFYYRDYPLKQIHPGAQKAAEAVRCAGDQSKYWEFHDLVFENQSALF